MIRLRSLQWRAALSGAVLGGLIWAALDALGAWSATTLNGHAATLALMIAVCALAGMTLLRPALWMLAGCSVAALVIVCYTPLSATLIRPLVRRDPIPPRSLDAVVVLSGGITADDLMGPQTLDRLLKGVELVRAGKGSALVLSTEKSARAGRFVNDSADQAKVLAMVGVAVPVYFIDSATSTRDEAMRVRKLPARAAWRRVALVTSPLHSRRACATFERAGFVVTCVPSDSRDRAVRNLDTTGDRLIAFQGWLYECAGWVKYRLYHWV